MVFNRERTKEEFGYDLDPNKRRTKAEIQANPIRKENLKVIDNCPGCNRERYINYVQSMRNKLCSKCFHSLPHVVEAKHKQVKNITEETRQKMRDNHYLKNGGVNPFKGKKHTKEARAKLSLRQKEYDASLSLEAKTSRHIKASCSLRGISIEDFDGWASKISLRVRGSKEYKQWVGEVRKRCQDRCFILGIKSSDLTAHHIRSFSDNIDLRLDPGNGVLIDPQLHFMFHNLYRRGGNTLAQLEEFKEHISTVRPVVYMVAGVAGSGKSWICEQLTDDFNYIPYDKTPKNSTIHRIYELYEADGRPILYDRFTHVSTFIKRFSHILDIKLCVIVEDEDRLIQRLLGRGGEPTESWRRRIKRMRTLAKRAVFAGSSEEVLLFLRQVSSTLKTNII